MVHMTVFLHFLPDLRQISTFNFPKVMRQLLQGGIVIECFYWTFPSLSNS